MSDKQDENVSNASVTAAAFDHGQSVQITPIDASYSLGSSPQAVLVPRRHNGILIMTTNYYDSTQADVVRGGPLSTLLKDSLRGLKGVTLQDITFLIDAEVAGGYFAMCLTTALDKPSNIQDVKSSFNSVYFRFNAATAGNRFRFTPSIPVGIGRQLVPPDPAHPELHVYMACPKFCGTVTAYITISCDVVVIKQDELF